MTGLYKETYVQYRAQEMGGASETLQDDGANDPIIQVRPYNMRVNHRIRDLDPSHIDKLI